MKEHTVRLSFDVPIEEHLFLKTSCALLGMSIKDFLHEQMRKGLEEIKERQLQERLKSSIKQSKEGKVKSRGSFSKYAKKSAVPAGDFSREETFSGFANNGGDSSGLDTPFSSKKTISSEVAETPFSVDCSAGTTAKK